jgi:hypothetical protein
MRRLLTLALVFTPLYTWADHQEASLDLEVGPAVMRLENPLGDQAQGSDTAIGAALGLRAGYGVSDFVALDVDLGLLLSQDATFVDPAEEGRLHSEDMRAFRAGGGVTFRLGVRWIPTVSAGIGYQYRWASGGARIVDGMTVALAPGAFPNTEPRNELFGTLGLGLDYRVGVHWIVGLKVQATQTLPFGSEPYQGLEIPFHISYNWYPGWFTPGGSYF